MKEYIERQAVVDAVYPVDPENDGSDGGTVVTQNLELTSADVEAIVCSIPSADVRPVVYARWIKEVYVDPYGADWTRYHCSLCGRVEIRREPYCNCGAQMEGTEETT